MYIIENSRSRVPVDHEPGHQWRCTNSPNAALLRPEFDPIAFEINPSFLPNTGRLQIDHWSGCKFVDVWIRSTILSRRAAPKWHRQSSARTPGDVQWNQSGCSDQRRHQLGRAAPGS